MKKILLLLCLLLIAGCREGTYVDKEPDLYVDTTSPPGFEKEVPLIEDGVLNESDEEFVPPPVEANATVQDETTVWDNRAIAKVWVWNELGSQQLYIAEGTAASISKLKVTVGVQIISSDGRVKFLVNGQESKTLEEKQETKVNNTWIFVSEVLVRN